MAPSDPSLLRALQHQLSAHSDAPALWLGLSGGLDSMLLLDLLAELTSTSTCPPLRAIHVHHGLHPLADQWAALCVRACARYGVPLQVERVVLARQASIEEAARDARYAVYERLLGPGDLLLLAQHADDQLETLIFRALRGAGLRGLAGMPRQRPLGRGHLLRPLLDVSRAELETAAHQRNLQWVEDPANADPRFARSWLRHTALPALRRQWPQTDRSLLRLAGHVAEAGALLDELAEADMGALAHVDTDPWLKQWPALQLPGLRRLSAPRQRNLLRGWLLAQGCRLPDQRHLLALQQQFDRGSTAGLRWEIDDACVLGGVEQLWLLPAGGMPAGQSEPLPDVAELRLSGGNGLLRQSGERPSGEWQIRYRTGGELIRMAGRPTQTLKKLFQEAGIPAWLRPAVPLIHYQGELVSVGGRWQAANAPASWCVHWFPAG
ncbi:MAG: tRNA lysidine(34) synthetase TilS [Halopseudomonas yangmingensis]|nr:tRNA lysidine(34) synthetase TilS [Halopseudomonas yangmingensis]